jgi:hypothetical protein
MEKLNKVETAAALAAIKAVIESGPGVRDDHPLKTALNKLDKNLKEEFVK